MVKSFKGPHDGIGGCVKRKVYHNVTSQMWPAKHSEVDKKWSLGFGGCCKLPSALGQRPPKFELFTPKLAQNVLHCKGCYLSSCLVTSGIVIAKKIGKQFTDQKYMLMLTYDVWSAICFELHLFCRTTYFRALFDSAK